MILYYNIQKLSCTILRSNDSERTEYNSIKSQKPAPDILSLLLFLLLLQSTCALSVEYFFYNEHLYNITLMTILLYMSHSLDMHYSVVGLTIIINIVWQSIDHAKHHNGNNHVRIISNLVTIM